MKNPRRFIDLPIKFERIDWLLAGLVFSAAFLPRLAWALSDHPPPFSDMEDYYRCAVEFLRGGYLAQSPDRLAYRTPGYPLFLSTVLSLAPFSSLQAVRLSQALLGALSAVLVSLNVYLITQGKDNSLSQASWQPARWIAAAAGLLFALSSGQVFFTGVLMTETLFVFMLLVWSVWMLCLPHGAGWLSLAGFSLWLGLMSLVKPIALFFLPIVVFKTLQGLPRSQWLRRGWLPLSAWLYPILPWTIRNALVLGHFVFLSTNSGVNVYIGHLPNFSYWNTGGKEIVRQEIRNRVGPNEVLEDRVLLRQGLKNLFDHPDRILPNAANKLYYLYVLDKPPWPWSEYVFRPNQPPAPIVNWPLIHWMPIYIPLILAGIVFASYRRLPQGGWLAMLGLYTFACLVFFARTRFRMPIEPFLDIYLAIGAFSLVEMAIHGYRISRNWRRGSPDPPHSP